MRARSQATALQRWEPPVQNLVWLSTTNAEPTASVRFRVPIPDARLRVKISVLFIPNGGAQTNTDDISSGAATLWLYASDKDRSGNTGSDIPETNVEGTMLAPTAIPQAPGLLGYSRSFVTSADFIYGLFSTTTNGKLGFWVLQVTYSPEAGQRFTEEEWDQITGAANPWAPSPAQVL